MTTPPSGGVSPKSRVIAGLLGIVLNGLGIHRFYLGYTSVGWAMVVLVTVASLLTGGFAGLVACLFGFIEGVLILLGRFSTDSQGRTLADN